MDSYDDEKVLEDRRQKQLYLKSEIIERNYDGAQFAEFLNSQKEEGGSNIDMWSFNELKRLVAEFRVIIDAQPVRQDETYDVLDSGYQQNSGHGEQDTDTTNTQFVVPSQDAGINDIQGDDYYSQVLNVKVSHPSRINEEKDPYITVGEPELVKGGLFSASFIQYKVTTQPFGWSVKRRFSDFFWLRSTLQKLHLGYVIPPVPQKKNKGKFENDFIRKRMYFLERFLNSCITNEDFKTDKFLYFFLSLADDNQLKAKMKEADKLLKVARLEDITNVSGQIPLEINPDLKYYAAHVGDLCNQTDPLYKQIRKLSKQLIMDLDQVSNTVFQIGDCYATLYSATNNYNKNVKIGKNENLDDVYITLNNMMVSWGEQVLGQIKIVQKNMSYFYKYAHYENESMREVVQARGKAGLEYIQKKKDLLAKKEKFFAQGDILRWELTPAVQKEYSRDQLIKSKPLAFSVMFPRETALVRDLRDVFAYQNAMTYSEVDKSLNEKCKQYSINFHEFAKAQAENLTEVHVHWADLMAHFTESKSKNNNVHIMNRNTIAHRSEDDDKGFSGQFTDE